MSHRQIDLNLKLTTRGGFYGHATRDFFGKSLRQVQVFQYPYFLGQSKVQRVLQLFRTKKVFAKGALQQDARHNPRHAVVSSFSVFGRPFLRVARDFAVRKPIGVHDNRVDALTLELLVQ